MRPILITGSAGTLGAAFGRICDQRGLAYHLTPRSELDIASHDSVQAALDRYEPWLVINAAGYVRVDDAERDHERCHRENALGPEILAAACSGAHVPMVSVSSDLVFDGRKHEPYEESDRPSPIGVYGRTKYEAEQRILERHPTALVVRTSAFFGPWDAYNFVTATLRELAACHTVRAADDVTISPTYVPDLVHACLDLAIDGATGTWHLANLGAITWAAFARAAARTAGYAEDRVIGVSMQSLGLIAPRPRFSALGSRRGVLLPDVDHALGRYHCTRKGDA
jgi:dTDP-4-dehydrorhamnose reductase